MKEVLRNLLILTLFLTPLFGQSSPAPSQNAGAAAVSDSRMVGDTMPAPQIQDSQDNALQFPVLRTLGGMGIVVFLMVGLYLGAKKFAPRFFPKTISQRNLKIVETLGMGDRRSISLIEVGNNRFLVGNTPHQINLLATLSEPFSLVSDADSDAQDSNLAGPKGPRPSFRNLFEVEKKRPSQQAGNSLPEDIRLKMRQLREALER